MLKNKKQKGSEFERQIAKDLVNAGLDKYAKRQVLSGAVFGLETDIRTKLPFSFELKRHEKIELYKFWEQAKLQKQSARHSPVLVVKSSNKPTLAIMEWNDWLTLVWYALKAEYAKET